jgi:hypothetical protein
MLFAIDPQTEEIIVSDSPKGSNAIHLIERIPRDKYEDLYLAVVTLTSLSKAANFDVKAFKAADKVCQMLYEKYKGGGV